MTVILYILGIVLAVGIVGNLCAYIILKKRRASNWTPFLSSGVSMADLNKVMPEETEENIEKILSSFSMSPNSIGGQFKMTYAPYTEHKDIAFESQFLNISEQGIRSNGHGRFTDPFNTQFKNVFLFGGSTTLGYAVKDADTIGAFLERSLRSNNDEYRVINSGRQSYFSTSELIAFQRFIQQGAKMDTVVFVDGLNDLFHNCPVLRNRTRFSETIEQQWDFLSGTISYDEPVSFRQMSQEISGYFIGRMPLTIFWKKFKKKLVEELKKRDQSSNVQDRLYEAWAQGYKADDIDPQQVAENAAQLTWTNWQMARALAKQLNIKIVLVLQPVYYVGTDLKKHLFKIKNEHPLWYQAYQKYYELMIEYNKGFDDFVDLSKLFKTVDSFPFVDSHHYSPYGNRSIAESISSKFQTTQETVRETVEQN